MRRRAATSWPVKRGELRRKTLVVLAVAAICTAGCGSRPSERAARAAHPRRARDVAEGRAHVKEVVERTAHAVVPGRDLLPDPEDTVVSCDDEAGRVLDTVLGSYGVRFQVDEGEIERLFTATADRWRALKMQVGRVDLAIVDPDLHATADDGYQYELHIVKSTSTATLDGTTPCVPAARSG
jgi:hypothetical protein